LMRRNCEVPCLLDVLVRADERAVLIDERLSALPPGQVEDAPDVSAQIGLGIRRLKLLTHFEQALPLPDGLGELRRVRGQAVLLEDVEAIEQRSGADVDRDAELLAVLGGGLLPFPFGVLRLVLLRAE